MKLVNTYRPYLSWGCGWDQWVNRNPLHPADDTPQVTPYKHAQSCVWPRLLAWQRQEHK